MAYNDPAGHVWVTGELVSAANLKTYTSDNIDALNKRISVAPPIATAETRANAAYGALATAGPLITVTTGVFALVVLTARMLNNTAGGDCRMSVAVSGATTIAAADANSNEVVGTGTANFASRQSVVVPLTLNAGANTFTSQYRSGGADTMTASDRNLVVIAQL